MKKKTCKRKGLCLSGGHNQIGTNRRRANPNAQNIINQIITPSTDPCWLLPNSSCWLLPNGEPWLLP